MAVNMTWQLAIAVLVPIIGGVQLDRLASTGHNFTFIGLGLAFIAVTAVMWATIKRANHLPVPKLSEAEKRKIARQYAEDDAE